MVKSNVKIILSY
ncbi:hypothetical protein SPV_2489 [Streptococcus pneumoniae]|nr:hypothetical protein SPV_2489 [Streptococcus pneumoniae]